MTPRSRRQSDAEAVERYSVAEHQVPGAGPAVKRTRPNLTSHVPIRFQPEVLAQVRIVAEHDGVTVSTWIRAAVGRAVAIRMAQIAPGDTAPAVHVSFHRADANAASYPYTGDRELEAASA